MDNCLNDSCHGIEWQASLPSILSNLKDKIRSISNDTSKTHHLSKTFTTEAGYMTCVLLSFLIFSWVGSSITIFEYFCKVKEKKDYGKITKKSTNAGERKNEFKPFSGDGLLKMKRFFKCFCFVTNVRTILAGVKPKEIELCCVYGIRAINFCWAISIHTSMFYQGAIKNLEDQGPFLRTWFPKAFLKGDYLNDAYFTLGGFLNAYTFFQAYEKNGGNTSWLHFFIKRITRVMPLYMIILSFYTTLFPYLGSGPVWPTYSTHPVCKNVWWWNFLFINNFLTAQNQCMIWTWYLANDFQFYIVSPLFMISLVSWPKLGYILTIICIFGSCLTNFSITMTFNLTTDSYRIGFHLSDIQGYLEGSFECFNKLNKNPYNRLSSYLIGILLGHYLSSRKRSAASKQNQVFLYCGWIFTATFMWIALFSIGSKEETLMKFATFNGMKHVLFSCGISWFIFVCSTGQAEFINRCLSCHGFVILSRISYCGYLINFFVLEYHFLNFTVLEEFSVTNLITKSAVIFFWTCVVSFVVSILIEIPVSRLYSMFSSKQKKD